MNPEIWDIEIRWAEHKCMNIQPRPPPQVSPLEGLSTSVLLITSANHDLNMCRRDMFKADLDENYKAIYSSKSKEPVAAELFADDLTMNA